MNECTYGTHEGQPAILDPEGRVVAIWDESTEEYEWL